MRLTTGAIFRDLLCPDQVHRLTLMSNHFTWRCHAIAKSLPGEPWIDNDVMTSKKWPSMQL